MEAMDRKLVVDVAGAAQYLMVSRQTVARLAKRGQIGRKVGKKWRFRVEDLERYLSPVVVSDSASRGANNEQVQAGNS